MNCKPGDLAVIVRAISEWQHVGKIVRVLRLVELEGENCWRTEPELRTADGRYWIGWRDRNLRPIRDSDGEDEMLRIAGKPQEVNA